MTLFNWSTTAADNDDADVTVNVREGWAPRIVNNSIRALMAAVAKFRDDISGALTTGGSSTAYTVTTNQVFTSLVDGLSIWLRFHVASGTNPTFAPDGRAAKPLASVYGTALPTGAIGQGSIHKVTYNATDQKWIVAGRFADTLTSGSNPDLVAIEALSGTSGALKKTAANTWALDDGTSHLIHTHNNFGSTVTTGVKVDIPVPFACTITGAYLYADQTGSIVIDLWKDTHANYPPTDADSITASAPITISSSTKAEDTTLSGWTTSVSAGDIIRVNVDSCTSITRFTLAIRVKRYG